MITYTNKEFDFLNPVFDKEDIAIGLSREGRFGNQYRYHKNYTVDKHSIIGSHFIEKPLKFAFLLHDAAEAYVRDLPTPLKKLCPDYTRIEKDIQQKIYEFFDIELDELDVARIKEVDNEMYEWEKEFLFNSNYYQLASTKDNKKAGIYYRLSHTHRPFLRCFERYARYPRNLASKI